MPIAAALPVREQDRAQLRAWTRATGLRAGLAQRARIVLLAAEGVPNVEIAVRVGVSRPTVNLWRSRYLGGGLAGLADRPRPGRPRRLDETQVVVATLSPPPPQLGVTHWSSRLLGDQLGVGNATVARVWRKWDLQPWRVQTFKFSTDPELDAKIRDVVGLYLTRHRTRSCSRSMRSRRSKPWTGPRRSCRCDPACRRNAAMTTSGTAPPRCSPPWRSPPGRSSTPATRGTATRSSCASSSRWPRPTRG